MRYLEEINIKLTVEDAVNFSDKEIERCFINCVCGHLLIPLAKKYRSQKLLKKIK